MNKKEQIQIFVQQREEMECLIHEKYHRLAQDAGLTLEQYHLLLELESLTSGKSEESDAPTIGHMARSVNLSQNTVSEKITRSEKKELVLRKKDEKDRRISRISLTEQGKTLLSEIERDASSRFLEEALSGLPSEDLEALTRLMGHLIDSMASACGVKSGSLHESKGGEPHEA